MTSNKKIGRIAGALLLFIFISGITVFQFLQSSILSSKEYVTLASENENQLILSTILGFLSGIASIIVAVILFPIFKKNNYNLALLYIAFCVVNFVAILLDNYGVVSMLEISKISLENTGEQPKSFQIIKTLLFEKHIWTHYFYLLISCFPVFVLYYTLFVSKLIPRVLSVFGVFAVVLMFVQILATILNKSISMNLMIPIALIQFIFPIWLLVKGLKSSELKHQ
ncbi:MAG: DUF4386 domain-containing protein [Polaribacter sp.]